MEVNNENKERYGIIYKIENTANGKCYIGQTTKSFNPRYNFKGKGIESVYKHNKSLKERNQWYNDCLLNEIEEYGNNCFVVNEEVDIAYNKEELDKLEKEYIKKYNSTNPSKGYNYREGGVDGKQNEITKNKMIENHANFKGKNAPMYGKHLSEEAKGKISKANKGRKHSDDEKRKMRENNTLSKKVICINDNKKFNTVGECAKYNKKGKTTISRVCRNKTKTKDGLCFMFYEEYIQQQQDQKVI